MEDSKLRGQVTAVVFRNGQNGWTVAKVRSSDGETVTAVGNMTGLCVGESIDADGEYVEHPQYGRQFSVRSFERTMPSSEAGIYEYLASGAVSGIGAKTAQLIVERFGSEAFEVIASDPERLASIRGISLKRALMMQKSFLQAGVLRALIEFLAIHKLPPTFAAPLAGRYGGDAVEAVTEDPYILCAEPFLLTFSEADRLASDLGIDGESRVRREAAILYELFFNLQNGHVFLPEKKLLAAAEELCGVSAERLSEALRSLCEKGRTVEETVCGTEACYLQSVYIREVTAARKIRELLEMKIKPPHDLEKTLSKIEKETGVICSEMQKRAVTQCFGSGISIITGGPGTGKTTALLTLIRLLEKHGLTAALAAPTGRAADRMSKICSREARTLHRLLETVPDESGEMTFKRNSRNPLAFDVVIIDEASMLDLNMSASLLDAMRPGSRLVLVGDADQLPPVGAGRFFSDLLESGKVPAVRLDEIFRQARESDIIVNAHKINHGEKPDLKKNSGDFYFSECRTAQQTASLVSELVGGRITEHFGIDPADIQVICPSRRNVCGTEEMNVRLQETLNPPSEEKDEIRFGDTVFRRGDRVMQIKNNYDRVWLDERVNVSGAGVYNGDTGVIAAVDKRARLLTVLFDGKRSEYSMTELAELELAFAVTAHKSQGSEYRAVIIPVFDCPQRLLTRNLLYTAATRAKELLIICGREDMLEVMIKSGDPAKRYGALKRRIINELKGTE